MCEQINLVMEKTLYVGENGAQGSQVEADQSCSNHTGKKYVVGRHYKQQDVNHLRNKTCKQQFEKDHKERII